MILRDIATALGTPVHGDDTVAIDRVSAIGESTSGSLTFLLDSKHDAFLPSLRASAIVTYRPLDVAIPQLVVPHPRKALAQALALFEGRSDRPGHIAPSADIHPSAHLGKGVSVGPFAVIEAGAILGDSVSIGAHAVVGSLCTVGDGTWIGPRVVLAHDVHVGRRVRLHPGAVIGGEGFGYYPEKGTWNKIPHVGRVVVEDDVEIGCNTCVDRGCIGDTVIGQGTKIDNLVHVAHNCKVGRHTVIAGMVAFSGSVTLGDHVMVGGQAGFRDGVKVGNNVTVMARAGVTKDIPDNVAVSGFPAIPHRQEMIKQATLSKWASERHNNRAERCKTPENLAE